MEATPTAPSRIKILEFIEGDPETWFDVCESTFLIHGVTDSEMKFHLLISALPSRITVKLRDVLRVQDAKNKYKILKDRLLSLYGLTPHEAFKALVALPPLGINQRPSELFSSMCALLPTGEDTSAWLFKHMFIAKLPQSLQVLALSSNYENLLQLAIVLDSAHSSGGSSYPPPSSFSNTVTLDHGTGFVSRDEIHRAEKPRSQTLCFFHDKFARKAKKCRQPCTWTGKDDRPGNENRVDSV